MIRKKIPRRIMQLQIEEAALKKETDHLSQDRLAELQKELAEEVRSSVLGRKKKTTQKDTDDDIEFIDL